MDDGRQEVGQQVGRLFAEVQEMLDRLKLTGSKIFNS